MCMHAPMIQARQCCASTKRAKNSDPKCVSPFRRLSDKCAELIPNMNPARPGTRQGTANIFVCVEPLAGKRTVKVTDRRCLQDFAHFLKSVSDDRYPDAKKIVLVVDNLNTHGPHALYETFPAEEAHRLASRFEWHFTPEHGSWLNMAECELSVMSRQCLNRRILDKATLIKALTAWELARNTAVSTINWQFTAADSRIKLRRLYPVTI